MEHFHLQTVHIWPSNKTLETFDINYSILQGSYTVISNGIIEPLSN